MTIFYVFCNNEFYACIASNDWNTYALKNYIMSSDACRVYSVKVE